MFEQVCIGQILGVAGEGEEGELSELQRLCVVESGEGGGGGLVVGVGAIAEDVEESERGGIFVRGGECLDLRCVEEFGEDEGIRGAGGSGDEICCCSWGGSGFGECEERL